MEKMNGRLEFVLKIEEDKVEVTKNINARAGIIPVKDEKGRLEGNICVPPKWISPIYKRVAVKFEHGQIVNTMILTEKGWKPERAQAYFIKKEKFWDKLKTVFGG